MRRNAEDRRAALAELTAEIVACRRCPRLVAWRERVAREKVARYRDETYWGRPLPGFGDPDARILIIGLAPAAHGGMGAYIAAAVRCAPPANKPTIEERDNCAPYLARELAILDEVSVIVPLGLFGWDAALRALATLGHPARPRPAFGHGAEAQVGPYRLVGSYHPSQQNTFTGRLTAEMLRDVLARARELAGT